MPAARFPVPPRGTECGFYQKYRSCKANPQLSVGLVWLLAVVYSLLILHVYSLLILLVTQLSVRLVWLPPCLAHFVLHHLALRRTRWDAVRTMPKIQKKADPITDAVEGPMKHAGR